MQPFKGVREVTQRFGARPEYYGHYDPPGHPGVDWGMPVGTEVLCARQGRVVIAGWTANTARGMHICIQHDNGMVTFYMHLDMVLVQVGELVQAGQVVGKSGMTGDTDGPHLHWDVRDGDGRPLDPEVVGFRY